MPSVKRLIMNLSDQEHADLSLKVREENLNQTALFRFLVFGYLKDEQNIRKAVDKFIEDNNLLKRHRKATHKRSVLRGKKLEKTFNLNNDDVEELYDIIEQLGDI